MKLYKIPKAKLGPEYYRGGFLKHLLQQCGLRLYYGLRSGDVPQFVYVVDSEENTMDAGPALSVSGAVLMHETIVENNKFIDDKTKWSFYTYQKSYSTWIVGIPFEDALKIHPMLLNLGYAYARYFWDPTKSFKENITDAAFKQLIHP